MLRILVPLALAASATAVPAQTFGTAVKFTVVTTNLTPGGAWLHDAPIEVRFDAPVDFATVNANTIRIRSAQGVPVPGTFSLPTPTLVASSRSVRRRRTCPTRPSSRARRTCSRCRT